MVLLVLALVLTVSRGLLRPYLDMGDAVAAKQSLEIGPKDSGLRVRVWVDRNRVGRGQSLRVWFAFANPASTATRVERIELQAPGFKPRTRSFLLEGLTGGPMSVSQARIVVPAGRTVTAWVSMTPADRMGGSFMTTRFTWRNARTEHQDTAEVGPVRIYSPGLQTAAQVTDSLFSLLGTLAIPLALALLGSFFQQRQQWLVQERQAWNAMLPVSHANNIKFYVPLLSGIKTFERRLEDLRDGGADEGFEEAAFYLLFALRRMREIDKSGSGFYLKTRQGEDIVSTCWSLFLGELRKKLPLAEIRYFLDCMRPMETFASFQRELEKRDDLKQQAAVIRTRLKEWVSESPDAGSGLRLILLFAVVLRFELNLIYRFWYGDEPVFPQKKYEDLMTALAPAFPDLEKKTRGYMAKYQGEDFPVPGGWRGLRASRSGSP